MQKSDNKTQMGIPTNHLLTYYYRLRKHRWLIVGTVFLTVFFSALFSLTMEPVFQSSSTIIIEEEQQESPLTGQRLAYENQFSQQLTFQTHFEMITSRPVLAKTLKNLGLKDESLKPGPVKKFFSSVKSNLKAVFSIFGGEKEEAEEEVASGNEETLLSFQIDALADKLSIGAVRGTRLLTITAEDNDPVVARNIANVLAETYILYDSEVRLASSQKMITWLNSQLYEMKSKVEEAERVFQEFKEKSGIFSLEGKKRISSQKMEELNTAYVKATAERQAVEAKIKELVKLVEKNKGESVRSVPGFMQNPFLNDLIGKLSFAEIEFKKIQGVYKPKHPEYIKAASFVKELRTKVKDQFQKALDNLRAERSVALAQENATKRAIANTETESMVTNRKEVEYSILERDVQTNRELYNTLLSRMKEAKVTDEITSTNLRLVGPAALPTLPVRPKKAFNILVGLLVGLSMGVGMALLLEYFDQTVHNKEDAEQHFQIPVLAEIPLAENSSKDQTYISPSLLEMPMNSLFAESYRVLSNSLMYSRLNRGGGMFVVTSASPGEGKSTISFNLGLTLSLQGLRVVVVETDMRLPASRREPALKGRAGLADILSETFSTEVKSGQVGDLSVVDIHALLEVQEKSGVLNYWNEEHQFTVYLLRGQIIDVDWPTRPPEERLGELLVRSGLLTRDQLNVALSRQKATSGRLGRVLINLGLITIDKIAGPLKLLTQENLRALYGLKSAHYSFEEKDSRSMINQYGPKEADLNSVMGKLDAGKHIPSKFLIDQLRRHLIQIKGTSLSLLLAGSSVPNPGALLSSNRMRFLVDLLSEEFDVVLFDSPPAGTISDSGAVATLSDGVIFVIRAGYARLGEIKRAQEHTTSPQTPIVGIVINAMDIRREPYYDTTYYNKYNKYYLAAGDHAKHSAKNKLRHVVSKRNGDKQKAEPGKA